MGLSLSTGYLGVSHQRCEMCGALPKEEVFEEEEEGAEYEEDYDAESEDELSEEDESEEDSQ